MNVLTIPTCGICGQPYGHASILACPQVAEVEYHPDGTVKRIVKTTAARSANS